MNQKAVGTPFSPVAKPARVHIPYLRFIYANKSILYAVVILVPFVLATIFASWLPLQPPLESNVRASLQAPSLEHPFGSDKLGRDVLSRTLAGSKVSLTVGFAVAVISLIFGLVLGTISGFYGKYVDRIIMGIVDIFLAFPSLLLAIMLVAILGAGIGPVIIAITVADVPRFIRLQRSIVLSLKSRTYIEAAKTMKASQGWLMAKHIIPNTIAPLLVAASIAAANAILLEASLSFIGLGIKLPEPSLGNIIKEGQQYLQQAWWISALPGLAIFLIAISLHFLSDGIRQKLDPKARK
ncbi:ABC transporter permease [Paenibacillus sp. GP183]|jgi:peptide/nickel transport system permease protein|uniref:ABC transporter permease n=1 Tax=Paenibacillus sp. GP183 TaxID=1882751 RepID=UPI000897961D|nr:ABC transporter permease [Paenibacillus sp. GP183]SEC82021.1 peptide/nickel transport system permease protein [Paenibacillus sp. GP183]